jgi:hypothetical protein
MQLLRNYSLVEEVVEVAETTSYATHPVVHQCAHHSQGKRFVAELSRLVVVAAGWAIPHESAGDWLAVQRRLLSHAQAGSQWVIQSQVEASRGCNKGAVEGDEEQEATLDAVHLLGALYTNHDNRSLNRRLRPQLRPQHTNHLRPRLRPPHLHRIPACLISPTQAPCSQKG